MIVFHWIIIGMVPVRFGFPVDLISTYAQRIVNKVLRQILVDHIQY